jgi:hypothetical protein
LPQIELRNVVMELGRVGHARDLILEFD